MNWSIAPSLCCWYWLIVVVLTNDKCVRRVKPRDWRLRSSYFKHTVTGLCTIVCIQTAILNMSCTCRSIGCGNATERSELLTTCKYAVVLTTTNRQYIQGDSNCLPTARDRTVYRQLCPAVLLFLKCECNIHVPCTQYIWVLSPSYCVGGGQKGRDRRYYRVTVNNHVNCTSNSINSTISAPSRECGMKLLFCCCSRVLAIY